MLWLILIILVFTEKRKRKKIAHRLAGLIIIGRLMINILQNNNLILYIYIYKKIQCDELFIYQVEDGISMSFDVVFCKIIEYWNEFQQP